MTAPAHNGTLIVAPSWDGSFSFSPAADFVGRDTFTYREKNNFGGLSAVTSVAVTVLPQVTGLIITKVPQGAAGTKAALGVQIVSPNTNKFGAPIDVLMAGTKIASESPRVVWRV